MVCFQLIGFIMTAFSASSPLCQWFSIHVEDYIYIHRFNKHVYNPIHGGVRLYAMHKASASVIYIQSHLCTRRRVTLKEVAKDVINTVGTINSVAVNSWNVGSEQKHQWPYTLIFYAYTSWYTKVSEILVYIVHKYIFTIYTPSFCWTPLGSYRKDYVTIFVKVHQCSAKIWHSSTITVMSLCITWVSWPIMEVEAVILPYSSHLKELRVFESPLFYIHASGTWYNSTTCTFIGFCCFSSAHIHRAASTFIWSVSA